MALNEKLTRTFVCEGEGCNKEFTLQFLNTQPVGEPPAGIEQWRVVQNNNGLQFGYCSGACESKAALSGKHDFQRPPQIQLATERDAHVAKKAVDKLIELRG